MKLAVIFLCLRVASFIGTSKGIGLLGGDNALPVLTCPLSERPARMTDACNAMINLLVRRAQLSNTTVPALSRALGCTEEQIDAIKSGVVPDIMTAFGSLEALLDNVVLKLTEAVFAKDNILFGPALENALGLRGQTGLLDHVKPLLHSTTKAVVDSLSPTLKNVLGLVAEIVGGILDGLTD